MVISLQEAVANAFPHIVTSVDLYRGRSESPYTGKGRCGLSSVVGSYLLDLQDQPNSIVTSNEGAHWFIAAQNHIIDFTYKQFLVPSIRDPEYEQLLEHLPHYFFGTEEDLDLLISIIVQIGPPDIVGYNKKSVSQVQSLKSIWQHTYAAASSLKHDVVESVKEPEDAALFNAPWIAMTDYLRTLIYDRKFAQDLITLSPT